MKAKSRAHTNIALIKYWGKKDEELKIPFQSSLSLTLEAFYTDTVVEYIPSLLKDELIIDDKMQNEKETKRVSKFMNYLRDTYQIPYYARITSYNHVPKGAGLASSASAYASIAHAALKAYNIDVSSKELSTVARVGSGSAARSVYGSFVIWEKGNSHETSYAKKMNVEWNEFRMIFCLINEKEKKFLSSETMKETVEKSPYYNDWVLEADKDILLMQEAIHKKDIFEVGKIAQKNALKMHATILSIGKWYFEPKTIEIMNVLYELQEKNIPAYFTMDAGPNIKIMTTEEFIPIITEKIKSIVNYKISKAGVGVTDYES